MPYSRISSLPKGVRNSLPKKAQRIYKKAYNDVHEHYADEEDAKSRAHSVAWSAVKKKYEKSRSGNWHEKD